MGVLQPTSYLSRVSFGPALDTYGQIPEGDAQVVAVLGVEARVLDEVHAAADDVARREGRPVRLSRARGAEGVAVVPMVAIRVFVPSWK